MGKQKSAAKVASNTSRHNPIARVASGPQFFPNSFDEAPEHRDPPSTPTPTVHTLAAMDNTPTPSPPSEKTPTAVPKPTTLPDVQPNNRPSSPPQTPISTTPSHVPHLLTPAFPESDRDLIMSFLQVTERNKKMITANAASARSKLSKFTPIPEKGFPTIHLSDPGQLLADIKRMAIMEWINVDHPKFLVRVFDYDGSDPTKMNPVISRRIKDIVADVTTAYNMKEESCIVSPPTPADGYPVNASPNTFLVHNVPGEIRDAIISQRIWSTTTLTFEACPFVECSFPTLLLNLAGFTTDRPDIVLQVIQATWSSTEVRNTIFTILLEFLDYKVAGGIETPRFNIYADSPTTNPDAWTVLREFLTTLAYPTSLYGIGTVKRLFLCTLCHSVSHPREPKQRGGSKNKNGTARNERP
ncbi:hypothetical protein EV363DRAFT_1479885 [Boletus edulis]|nr:hypothetical protein EV363DRAFT_1479885 [Boletus edulis]